MNFTPLQSNGRYAQRSSRTAGTGAPYAADPGFGTASPRAAYAGPGQARRASYRTREGVPGASRTAVADVPRSSGGFRSAASAGRGTASVFGRRAARSTAGHASGRSAADSSNEAVASDSPRGRARRASGGSLIRYATDNVVVRAVYALTTGPFRFAFYAAVVLAIGASLYMPLRGWYVAARSEEVKNDLYQAQLESNAAQQAVVDQLLSQDGIKEIARSKLGLVEPGEISGMVVGLGEKDDSDTGASADAADAASSDDSGSDGASDEPWYKSVLDRVFFFSLDDVQGLTTVGSGA